MGDHLCSGAPAAEPEPPLPAASLFNRFNPFGAQPTDKQSRMPPQVDTSAASARHLLRPSDGATADDGSDRSYTGQGQLTPVSLSSGSQSISPKTPNGELGAEKTDEYFATQIANDSPPPQQSRRPGGYGGFGDGDGYEDSLYPANSPKKQAPSILQRMNTIAPGPFDSSRRPSAPGRSFNEAPYDRPGSSLSTMSSSFPSAKAPKAPRKNGYGGFGPPERVRPDLTVETRAPLNRSETFPRPSDMIEPPLRTPSAPGPRPDRLRRPSDMYDMDEQSPMTSDRTRRPSRGPDTSRPPPPRTSLIRPTTAAAREGAPAVPAINFAEEFGIGNPYHAPSESSSSSGSGVTQSDRRPSQASSRTSPPRSSPPRSERKISDTPSLDVLMSNLQLTIDQIPKSPAMRSPSVKLPVTVIQMPPKDRTIRPSPLAGRPRPPRGGYDPRIDPTKLSTRPTLGTSPLASPVLDTSFRDDPTQSTARDVSPVSPAPSQTFSSLASPYQAPSYQTPPSQMPQYQAPPSQAPPSQMPQYQMAPPQVLASQAPPPRTGPSLRSNGSNGSPDRDRDGLRSRPQAADPAPSTVRSGSRSRPQDAPVQSSRGDCKACGLPITGKSISSADGRLTGRYHKACFVCSTCQEPFSSSTFYVLTDRPYCHRHYHELNGSLCGSCDNGIEGQYLEDESAKKHHVGCFRCGDCNMVLKDGYFDVNGKSYCEKDAWKRVQQPFGGPRKGPPGSNLGPQGGLPGQPRSGGFGLPSGGRLGPRPRMEKRMTRLGMM
ncbi:hypothetical protein B0T17DRAFT_592650 [Bombardia bombarda]|uniref:LIM zinc-binding domain-containing protein n=1 Tax=Bombardia bombarda TaxID=252184 RepID=A0AA39WIG9_9PEZI|nr:hypothetical protein B0T17DRAFT_592650 [Bombardia bombarda]